MSADVMLVWQPCLLAQIIARFPEEGFHCLSALDFAASAQWRVSSRLSKRGVSFYRFAAYFSVDGLFFLFSRLNLTCFVGLFYIIYYWSEYYKYKCKVKVIFCRGTIFQDTGTLVNHSIFTTACVFYAYISVIPVKKLNYMRLICVFLRHICQLYIYIYIYIYMSKA